MEAEPSAFGCSVAAALSSLSEVEVSGASEERRFCSAGARFCESPAAVTLPFDPDLRCESAVALPFEPAGWGVSVVALGAAGAGSAADGSEALGFVSGAPARELAPLPGAGLAWRVSEAEGASMDAG